MSTNPQIRFETIAHYPKAKLTIIVRPFELSESQKKRFLKAEDIVFALLDSGTTITEEGKVILFNQGQIFEALPYKMTSDFSDHITELNIKRLQTNLDQWTLDQTNRLTLRFNRDEEDFNETDDHGETISTTEFESENEQPLTWFINPPPQSSNAQDQEESTPTPTQTTNDHLRVITDSMSNTTVTTDATSTDFNQLMRQPDQDIRNIIAVQNLPKRQDKAKRIANLSIVFIITNGDYRIIESGQTVVKTDYLNDSLIEHLKTEITQHLALHSASIGITKLQFRLESSEITKYVRNHRERDLIDRIKRYFNIVFKLHANNTHRQQILRGERHYCELMYGCPLRILTDNETRSRLKKQSIHELLLFTITNYLTATHQLDARVRLYSDYHQGQLPEECNFSRSLVLKEIEKQLDEKRYIFIEP